MTSAVKLHPYTYKLLIEQNVSEFSATHLRDALLRITDEYTDMTEARKFIHRQLIRLEALGYIDKIGNNGKGTKSLYKKTQKFYSTTFSLKKMPKNSRLVTLPTVVKPDVMDADPFLLDLKKEKIVHEAKLAVILGEIEEYQSLMKRFPTKKTCIIDLYMQAKTQSAALLGRVTALSKVLGQHNDEPRIC